MIDRAILVILFIPLFASALRAQCADPANVYMFVYNGRSYEVVRENRSWIDAAACAAWRGGTLAYIDDAAEQAAVFTQVLVNAGIQLSRTIAPDGGGASYVWLGGNDLATEGSWMWDGANTGNGTQFWQGLSAGKGGSAVGGLYSNWGLEPDNYGASPGQDALALALTNWPLGMSGQWNDISASNQIYFVIEHPSIIPVEMSSFGYRLDGAVFTLSWSTAGETNNLGWTVERRAGDTGEWLPRGFVPGAGSSTAGYSYTWSETLDASAAVWYYRLKQIDYDGSATLSPQLHVTAVASESEFTLAPLYPQPATQGTTLHYTLRSEADLRIELVDVAGRSLRTLHEATHVPAGQHSVHLRMDALPAGRYFLRVETGNTLRVLPVLLLR